MSQWFFHTPADNQRHGPLDEAAAQAFAQRTPGALAWREGMRECRGLLAAKGFVHDLSASGGGVQLWRSVR